MSNVVPFEEFDNEHEIAAYQIGLPRIVLEGMDDVRLFRTYWFPHMIDSFEFVEAGDIVDGGGCTAVKEAVTKSKQDNIPAFGIWDRDTFFRTMDWNALFEVDDAAFCVASSGQDFYTTLRWEVEAYLLEPDLLPAWLRSHRRPPGNAAQCAAAIEIAVDECEHLLRAHRFFATAHQCGKPIPPAYFLDCPTHKFMAACDEALSKLTHDGSLVAAVDGYVEAIIRAAPSDPPGRLLWLLRYVDTKRLLARLTKRFKAEPEVRWFLAELMLQGNRRPSEIERKLLELRDTLAA
jgi:hypothetical protein